MILVDASHAATLLLELRENGRTIPELPDGLRPGTFEEAYAIQDELHRLGGWGVGALKVGCTSEFAQQALGIDSPVVGVVADTMTFGSGADIARSMFHHDPLLEGEFAIRVGVDLDDSAQVDDPRAIADGVAPAVELIASRFDNVLGASGPSTVADNVANAALVLGEPVDPPPDLASRTITLVGPAGTEVASGAGAAVLGDPYESFAWALRHELARGRSIAAGTWVTTGTCTGISACPLGAEITAIHEGIGQISFTVVD